MAKKSTNRNLIIFETALIVGLISILLENWIKNLNIHIFLKISLIMFMIGGLFSIFFKFIEPMAEGLITSLLSRRNNLRKLIVHGIIILVMFGLYALFYFGIKLI